MTVVSGAIYTGIFYTWGDKELEKNGKWPLRLGYHGSYIDNYIFYVYQEKTYQTRFQSTGDGLFLHGIGVHFVLYQDKIQVDFGKNLDSSIKNETNGRVYILTHVAEGILAYSYYFN